MLQEKCDDKLPLEYSHLIILARLCRNFHIYPSNTFVYMRRHKTNFYDDKFTRSSHISQFMNRIGRKEFDSALEKKLISSLYS